PPAGPARPRAQARKSRFRTSESSTSGTAFRSSWGLIVSFSAADSMAPATMRLMERLKFEWFFSRTIAGGSAAGAAMPHSTPMRHKTDFHFSRECFIGRRHDHAALSYPQFFHRRPYRPREVDAR